MKRIIVHHFDQNAHAILRFGKDRIIGIYDERKKYQGKDVAELIGLKKRGIIISGDFNGLLKKDAEIVITTGEGLYFTKEKNVKDWKRNIMNAMKKGLDIYNMSKIFYGDKTKDFRRIAKQNNVKFIEASDPEGFEKYLPFAKKAVKEGIKAKVINFTGTGMNTGKLTAMLTVKKKLEEKNLKVGVVGTEPCSRFIGADEQVIPEVMPTMKGAQAIFGAIKKIDIEKNPDMILIGNQTGLRASVLDIDESRAGAIVAWQVLLGSKPTRIVLCTKWFRIEEIKGHLELIKHGVGCPIPAIVINGRGCEKNQLSKIIEKVENENKIFCLDVLSTPEKLDQLIKLLIK